uniref:Uncharacterized protein n=1 Tax=Anguilla anguilla TaxID=7936 RepID=A0A0E9RA37_ANGAN
MSEESEDDDEDDSKSLCEEEERRSLRGLSVSNQEGTGPEEK